MFNRTGRKSAKEGRNRRGETARVSGSWSYRRDGSGRDHDSMLTVLPSRPVVAVNTVPSTNHEKPCIILHYEHLRKPLPASSISPVGKTTQTSTTKNTQIPTQQQQSRWLSQMTGNLQRVNTMTTQYTRNTRHTVCTALRTRHTGHCGAYLGIFSLPAGLKERKIVFREVA